MIPKKIHYCWFGGNPLPELAERCILSWKKFCPDYEIIEWNESNYDVKKCSYVKEAYEAKKWAFVSDYARLDIIYHEGGIYLDTDIELLKSLDDFLLETCYLAEETTGLINTGLGFGAEKGSSIIKELLNEYDGKHFLISDNLFDLTVCPVRNTKPLKKYGYQFDEKKIWKYKGVTVYPIEYFCPMDYETKKMCISENTVSIHHYSALWISDEKKRMYHEIYIIREKYGKMIGSLWGQVIQYRYSKKNGEIAGFIEFVVKKINKIYYKLKVHYMKK